MRILVLLLILIGLSWGSYQYYFPPVETITQPPGVMVAHDPVQQSVNRPSWQYKDMTISPVAVYVIQARILSKSHYILDHQSNIAPYDLAVGWKRMSDSTYLDQMEISQSSRWYYLRWPDGFSMTQPEIFAESANMHLIPADDKVRQQIAELKIGQVVTLLGYLVNVKGDDGFYWNSSQSRSDMGDGSCELMWVTGIKTDLTSGSE